MAQTEPTDALWRIASARMPTRWGMFKAIGFEREVSSDGRRVETALAITLGDLTQGEPPLLRIHSQCFTGEMLGSLRCDCGDQLAMAMQAIAEEGHGLVIYEYQEGRGIGLTAKLEAYELQDAGIDTIEANHALGLKVDYRDFSLPAAILHELGVSKVRLLSNNPHKVRALSDTGIEIVAVVPCEVTPNPHSLPYLRTKKERLGHALTLAPLESMEDPRSPHVGRRDGRIQSHNSHVQDDLDFANIEEAIRELRAGRMVVVVDDPDRENEGDLTMAAEMITQHAINFMATHGTQQQRFRGYRVQRLNRCES
jgi:GTP cyclohydrolase II